MVSVTLNVHSLQHFFRSKGRCLESYILLYRIELFHGRVSQRLVLTKIYEIRSPFLCVPSTYEVEHVARQWTALNFQRKGRGKCLRWFLFAFRDKQTTDWLRDVSEYFQFEGVFPEVEHSNLLLAGGEGGGISYSHCWGACEAQWRGGLYKLEGFFGLDNVW